MRVTIPQFPPKLLPFLPPLIPEMHVELPGPPKPSSLTLGYPPSVSVTFDMESGSTSTNSDEANSLG